MAITSINLGKIKFNWRGAWALGQTYVKDDVVRYNGSSYACIVGHTSATSWATNSSKFELMVEGSTVTTTKGDIIYRETSQDARLPIGSSGQVLTVVSGVPTWQDNGVNTKIYYVSPTGSDANSGLSWGTAFSTIKHACTQAVGPATIYVASGVYLEQLPITVPSFVAVVGDNQRTTTVKAAPGYEQQTMWRLGDGALLNKMLFEGLTGYVPYAPNDQNIDQSTIGGVYVAFDPLTPIATKSPYVIECSAKSAGSVGALLDGSVHATGLKSMVFHGYTVILDGGVGFWVKDNAKSEIVSCFTYFCHTGYAATRGGKIRALNGNNSYGTYGVLASGTNLTETTLNGTLYGDMLEYTAISLTGGSFSVGNTITGQSSGAVAVVTNVQPSARKIYYKVTSGGPFTAGETISNGLGVSAAIATGGVTGQSGFILIATGFVVEPRPGGSIEFTTGDTNTYVIQSVSGWTNSSSVTTIVLAGEKSIPSVDGTSVKIRYDYSNIRLTGHDFLSIGTGGVATTNYPGIPFQAASQGNEVIELFPARVFYVSTDQDGNFRVGEYFKVDQATGRATLNASAFDLSGLTSLRLGSIGAQLGEQINEFSADATLSGNSNLAVPTEQAVKTYFTQVSSNIVPSVTNLYTLGTSSILYDKIYVNKVIGPSTLILDPAAEGNDTGTVQIKGNLQVDGTTTTINSTTLTVDDKNIVLGSGAINDAAADGSGITVESGDGNKTFNWVDATNAFTANQNIGVASTFGYLVDGTSVLNATTLGSGVTASSLTSVGTLTSLTVSGTVAANGSGGITTSQTGTVPLFNTNATGLNIGGAATAVAIGAGTGTTTINNNAVVAGDLEFRGGDLTVNSSSTTVNIVNTNATTVNAFGAGTAISIGAGTGTTTINNDLSIATGKTFRINNTTVLSATALGSGVTSSSLTSVGTLGSLSVTNLVSGGAYYATANQSVVLKDAANGAFLGHQASDGTSGWSLSTACISIKADTTTYASMGMATGNGILYFARTATTNGSMNSWLEVANTRVATFKAGITVEGNISATGTITSNSDATLKTNVSTIENALEKALALRGVMYNRISNGNREMGMIAQEVEAIIPELVVTDENGIKSLAYANTVALLVEAIKEQQKQIDDLKGKI